MAKYGSLLLILAFFCFSFTAWAKGCPCSDPCQCPSGCGVDLSKVNSAPQTWGKFYEYMKQNGMTPMSAYRSLACQAHLYACLTRCGTVVARPSKNAPHVGRIALDYSLKKFGKAKVYKHLNQANAKFLGGRGNLMKPHPGAHIDSGGGKSKSYSPSGKSRKYRAQRPARRKKKVTYYWW